MSQPSLSARYAAATAECGGRRPIEAGALGRLADHECCHGRLAYDRTPPCGCWLEDGGRRGARAVAPGRGADGRAPRRVNNPEPDMANVRKENQIMRDIATATLSGNLVGERPNVEAREHGGPAVVQHRCGSVVAAAEPIGHAFGDDAVEAGGEQSEKRPCIFSRERLVKPAGGFERLIRHGRPFPGHLARRPSAA